MAVLMSAGGAAGGPGGGERRCDGTCHNARRPVCVCICGGRYHGKGTSTAFEEHTQDALDGMWGEDLKRVTELYQQAKRQAEAGSIRQLVHLKAPAATQTTFNFV